MSYQKAIEAAGASVKEFQYFSQYQGEWFALLEDGRVVNGSYGSCSVCDAFEAEFGWNDEDRPDYQQRLANFGQTYMAGAETLEEVVKRYRIKCKGEHAWDDDREILKWLESKLKEQRKSKKK